MQAQTFYFSNMTPQKLQPEPESLGGAREKWRAITGCCSDTLYVVTGAYWNPAAPLQRPISEEAVPRAELLFQGVRPHGQGNVSAGGRPAGDYPADQLKSIGFWVENAGGQGLQELGEKRFGGRKPHGFRILPFGARRRQGAERRRLVGIVKP